MGTKQEAFNRALDKHEVDRKSHSYLLGVCEYERDKYKAALEHIASYEISDDLNYYNARAMVERARAVLGR
jgi:hypothetical protein